MNKIKLLVLASDTDGVGSYRVINPHLTMDDPDIDVDIRMLNDPSLPMLKEEWLGKYNIIFINKAVPFTKEEHKIKYLEIIRKYNIKVVYDSDDYWVLTNNHPNYKIWKEKGAGKVVEEEIGRADAVTTTTEELAKKIRDFNPNVHILENAVNPMEQQWTQNKYPSEKTRFLWGGGITHLVDLRLLKSSIEKFDKYILENSQLYLCGYDLRMNTPKGVKVDDPNRSTWTFFESIFTNNFRWIKNPEYYQWLRKYTDNGRENYGINEKYRTEFYQRRWTKPILTYGTMYNEADVVISPLKGNLQFNLVKSQLKVIEAGVHGCPIIASNYGPYQIDDIEGKIDGKQKGFLIDESDNYGWLEKIKFYIDNPDIRKEHGKNIHEYFLKTYDINIINKKRAQLYKDLINGN